MPKTAVAVAEKESAPAQTTKAKQGQPCLCGCGEITNPNRMFRQGHDQRLVGLLADDVVTGNGARVGFDKLPAGWDTTDMADRIERARRVITDRFSAALAAKFESAATRRAQRAGRKQVASAKHATVAQLHAAAAAGQQAKSEGVPEGAGSAVRFKVGKRPKIYDGFVHGMNQAGKVTAVRYATASGKETVTTNFTLVV